MQQLNRSHIFGTGYGSDHNWMRTYTRQLPYNCRSSDNKCSTYQCSICGVTFKHFYDVTPDIFDAIKQSVNPVIKEKCVVLIDDIHQNII